MERCGVSTIKPHLQKVYQDSSWEGGAPAILRHIPVDDEIEGLYDIYTDRPVAASAPSDSSTGRSLFNDEPSNSSTGSLFDDYRKLTSCLHLQHHVFHQPKQRRP
jgi:hypothetical protein